MVTSLTEASSTRWPLSIGKLVWKFALEDEIEKWKTDHILIDVL